jgi:Probable cobalt transporter subunit (CbtB)
MSSVNAGRTNPEEVLMSEAVYAKPADVAAPPFSVGQVLPWLILAGLLFLVALYFVSAEQGATSVFSGTAVHEWVHDGRHLLGFPCH